MPFEKKKKYKTAKYYKQKNLYLNESDPYQYECFRLLELCGHYLNHCIIKCSSNFCVHHNG